METTGVAILLISSLITLTAVGAVVGMGTFGPMDNLSMPMMGNGMHEDHDGLGDDTDGVHCHDHDHDEGEVDHGEDCPYHDDADYEEHDEVECEDKHDHHHDGTEENDSNSDDDCPMH